MNTTIELLRILESPSESATFSESQDRLVELSKASARNRMLFFYLQHIGEKKLGKLSMLYESEFSSYNKTLNAITQASRTLANARIKHAFFKTIRPYKSTTVDLDILIFKAVEDYNLSVKAMQAAGYELIVHGPRSTTLRDTEADIGIDLYSEIAVSSIIYIDKKRLTPYVSKTKLPSNEYIMNLNPEADLLCIIAHSLVKEQMYVLSEYYTFIKYLRNLDTDSFLNLVKQNNLTNAARIHANMTALLHKTAHRTTPKALRQILKNLGGESFETTRLISKNYETPHKYHPTTVARSLMEIAKTPKARESLATQIVKMANPTFSKTFFKALMQHRARHTY